MNRHRPLHEKIAEVRSALASYRDTGVLLNSSAVSKICAALALQALEAEMMMYEQQRLLEQLDSKVVSLSRHRRANPFHGHDGGDPAA